LNLATGDDDQATSYLYENDYDASLTTNVIYPDSSDEYSTGTDQVKFSHNLDGSIATRTDQIGTKITFVYNNRRQMRAQKVNTNDFGSDVDQTIKAGHRRSPATAT